MTDIDIRRDLNDWLFQKGFKDHPDMKKFPYEILFFIWKEKIKASEQLLEEYARIESAYNFDTAKLEERITYLVDQIIEIAKSRTLLVNEDIANIPKGGIENCGLDIVTSEMPGGVDAVLFNKETGQAVIAKENKESFNTIEIPLDDRFDVSTHKDVNTSCGPMSPDGWCKISIEMDIKIKPRPGQIIEVES